MKRLRLTRTPAIIRPFADFGTLLWIRILKIPFYPFTLFRKRYLFECQEMIFLDKKDFAIKCKNGEVKVGSICDMHWEKPLRTYPDGKKLVLLTPYGWWDFTRRSSTCTRKNDDLHYCWVKSGSLSEGTFTIGKKGDTCESGAGSVGMRDKHGNDIYHARLMNNQLVEIPFF